MILPPFALICSTASVIYASSKGVLKIAVMSVLLGSVSIAIAACSADVSKLFNSLYAATPNEGCWISLYTSMLIKGFIPGGGAPAIISMINIQYHLLECTFQVHVVYQRA